MLKRMGYTKLYRVLLGGMLVLGQVTVASGASLEDIRLELERARQELRLSKATEARIASEFEQLRSTGHASSEILKDYETYLIRVRTIRVEHQKLVHELETTYARLAPLQGSSGLATSRDMETMPRVNLPDATAFDEVATLDRELSDSLAAFDDMLLITLDEIRARSVHAMRDLASEAAAAAKRLRQQGVEIDTSVSSSEAEAQAEASETDTSAGTAAGEAMTAGSGAAREGVPDEGQATSRKDGTSRSQSGRRVRLETPDDDDIVARQLREAAEQETDPELKEKLWQEYDDYKKGSRQ